jgi:hypothetical protein
MHTAMNTRQTILPHEQQGTLEEKKKKKKKET